MDTDTHDHHESNRTSTLEQLGTALREARLSQGLDRGVLAAKLHMGDEQLKALENADLDRLPEPVFVIAQARRVADALGIDISQLVAPLRSTDSPIAAAAPSAGPMGIPQRRRSRGAANRRSASARRPPPGRAKPTGSSPWRPLAVLALASGLVVGGTWLWPHLPLVRQATASRQAPALQNPALRPRTAVKPARKTGLLLRSAEPSWLEVRQGEGTLFKGTFAGEKRFPLTKALRVLAGRPDLVLVSVDGSTPQPLGTIDDIRWVILQPGQPFKPKSPAKASKPAQVVKPAKAPAR